MNQHFRQLCQFQVVRVSRKRLRCLFSFFLRLGIRLVKFAVDTLELFLLLCVRMEEHGMQKPLGLRVETEGV